MYAYLGLYHTGQREDIFKMLYSKDYVMPFALEALVRKYSVGLGVGQ